MEDLVAYHRGGINMALKVAYGGVVFDDDGWVLLREPKNHFDGYVWTFPKGRPNLGGNPEEAALREVLEETGVIAAIIGQVPGSF
jgi:ADP-ribose pyrophosphatase YjhB (NUDIX family)